MTAQAQNSINLYRGNPASTILTALKFQKASVVNELKEKMLRPHAKMPDGTILHRFSQDPPEIFATLK